MWLLSEDGSLEYRHSQRKVLDWRNYSEYEPILELPPNRVAWEFLRRNEEYRRDFRNAIVRSRQKILETDDLPPYPRRRRIISRYPAYAALLPHFRSEVKWGFKPLVDPDEDEPAAEFLAFYGIPTLGIARFGGADGKDLPEAETLFPEEETLSPEHFGPLPLEVDYRFDLELNLSPQIREAQRRLFALQGALKERGIVTVLQTTPHRKKHAHYCQLLDAAEAGASPREIADFLNRDPLRATRTLDERTIRERLKAAGRLTQRRGYQDLL